MSLATLRPLWDVPGVRFISLQKGPGHEQLASFDRPLVDIGAQVRDFADTAAVIANLDLLISIDSAVVHVAGAMAKAVWTMLPFCPDWRWLLDRDDSPWYPTMTLFRQTQRGQWTDVVQRVADRLRGLP
jgi:hypothetical protein